MMTFPDTVEEFMEEYKLVDTEQVYTNGTELVPIFRMKQWFEHEAVVRTKNTVASNDCISRRDAIDAVEFGITYVKVLNKETGEVMELFKKSNEELQKAVDRIEAVPSVKPEIIRCKDCKHIQKWRSKESAKKFGQIYECARNVLNCPKPEDFCSRAERKE